MAVRNCAEIGENLQKIVRALMGNQNLLKYLYYTDKDPLSHKEDLTDQQKQEEIFQKLIKIVPVIGSKETAHSIISIRVTNGTTNLENSEFRDILLSIEVFVPVTQWILKSDNLRPFLIMGEIQKTLAGKKVNGLGKLSGGDFSLNYMTEEISCYEQMFSITTYD